LPLKLELLPVAPGGLGWFPLAGAPVPTVKGTLPVERFIVFEYTTPPPPPPPPIAPPAPPPPTISDSTVNWLPVLKCIALVGDVKFLTNNSASPAVVNV
jgi:hypothetical protein